MKPLEAHFARAFPPSQWREVTVLLAVSGGADSVALLRAAAAVREQGPGRLIVAHYNHALRGAESDADEQFVSTTAARLGLACRTGRAIPRDVTNDNASAIAPSVSEEDARAGRYEFLISTARTCGARYVATAHTADDQAETVLHHTLRGTGLAGLSGMPNVRELAPGLALVRPLLDVRRSEVIEYLAEIDQPFREDSSNSTPAYTRNRLRHELLPQLAADYNPRVVEALLRLGVMAGEAHAFIEAQAAELADRTVIETKPESVVLDPTVLAAAPRLLVRETLIAIWRAQAWPLQAMSFDHWEQLADMAATVPPLGQTRKQVFPGAIHVERSSDRMELRSAER